ncbi:superoxide dismutase, partial [Streptomyces rubiginosohelvolus]
MPFTLPELPYPQYALDPHLSAETVTFHWGRHHKAYVDDLNKGIEGTEWEDAPLEDIVKQASGSLAENAAQHWNHTFYWHSLSPNGGGDPHGTLQDVIVTTWG